MTTPTARLQPYETLLPYDEAQFPTYDGTLLHGNFYRCESQEPTAPVVIFCHGLGLLKEQYLENWFKHAIKAGYHVLAYDHRSFGHSEGLPRENFNWFGQVEDFVDAVTYVASRGDVQADKIFAWGVAHAGGVIAMAAAMDKRLAGIIMFLPCIDGAYDKSLWGEELWKKVQQDRYRPGSATESISFWPLTEQQASGKGGSVLSGEYVRDWSVVAQKMAEQGGNKPFTGRVTLASFWSDFNCRPMDFFDRISPTPILWIMATKDIVCGPLEMTKAKYAKLQGPKDLYILEGEHLPQYFGQGFTKSVEAMLQFLQTYTQKR